MVQINSCCVDVNEMMSRNSGNKNRELQALKIVQSPTIWIFDVFRDLQSLVVVIAELRTMFMNLNWLDQDGVSAKKSYKFKNITKIQSFEVLCSLRIFLSTPLIHRDIYIFNLYTVNTYKFRIKLKISKKHAILNERYKSLKI
jgi:hypothetical protein